MVESPKSVSKRSVPFCNGKAGLRRVSDVQQVDVMEGRSMSQPNSQFPESGASSRSIALAPVIPAPDVMSWQVGRVAGLPCTASA